MRVDINEVVIGEYDIREEMDQDHIDDIAESFEKDGQWNPIIVRPRDDGQYDVVSGHYRTAAAKQLGWDEIEANVKNVEDDEADFLALKTNLIREGMSNAEQGSVLLNIMQTYDMTQSDVADELGKHQSWVSRRVKAASELHSDIIEAIEEGDISESVGMEVIGTVDEEIQPELLNVICAAHISTKTEAREYRDRFLNDTLYTIGYQGRDWDEFVSELEENGVDVLVDVRASTLSQYKPDFEGTRMKKALAEEDIEYINPEELGVPYEVREPYTNGYIDDEAFKGWYEWQMKETDFMWEEFVGELEEKGSPALMCMEKYAEPDYNEQDHYCHRSLTADYFQKVVETDEGEFVAGVEGRELFPNRVDL